MTNQVNEQSLILSTDEIQLTLTLTMTTVQVVETSVTVNKRSPIQDYVHLDDHTQPAYEMIPGFKPFTIMIVIKKTPTSDKMNKNIHSINYGTILKLIIDQTAQRRLFLINQINFSW